LAGVKGPLVGGSPDLVCNSETVWAEYTFVCGAGSCYSTVERSLNAGEHWATITLPPGSPGLGSVTSPLDAWFGLSYAGGNYFKMAATTDGGSTFRTFTIFSQGGTNLFVDNVTFADASHGWAVVDDPSSGVRTYTLVGTSDGGATWHVISTVPGG
jgi:hypothetical protein